MRTLTLEEHISHSYGPRTYLNAGFSDMTAAFAVNFNTAGEILTEKAAKGRILQFEITKDFDPTQAARTLYKYMKEHHYKTLNIAGNAANTFHAYGFNQYQINEWIYRVLALVHKYLGIERIRSGGQTGADLAGAVASVVLNIPAIITYPNQYRQRLVEGTDIIQSHDEALDTIMRYAQKLKEVLQKEKS